MNSIEQNLSQSTQFTDFHLLISREVLDTAQEKLGLGTGASTLRFLVGLAARVPATILRRLAQGDIQPGDFYDAERSADTLPKREEAPPPLGAAQPHDADDDSGESEEEESEEQLPDPGDQGADEDPYTFLSSPLFDGGASTHEDEYRGLYKAARALERRAPPTATELWGALVARAYAVLLSLVPSHRQPQLPSFLASLEASSLAALAPLFRRIRRYLGFSSLSS
jgi:hypothetical protein